MAKKIRPTGRRSILEALGPEGREKLYSEIRAGAFEHVAARCNGIAGRTYWELKAKGRAAIEKEASGQALTEAEKLWKEFVENIEQAHASARVKAETRVYEENPQYWLGRGPARDKGPENPGWSERHEVTGADGKPLSVEVSATAEFLKQFTGKKA